MFFAASAVGLLLGMVPFAPQDDSSGSELPEDVVAKVNGRDVGVQEYGEWLLAHHGWAYLQPFLEVVALRQEAERLGVEVGPEELEQAYQRDWQDNVLMRFAGDETRFRADLERSGMDEAGWRARRMQTLETEELARRLAVLARDPTEEQLRTTFEQEFGAEHERIHLRVAFFDRLHGVEMVDGVVQVAHEELNRRAMERARAFLAEARQDPQSFQARLASDTDLCLLPRWDSYVRDLREHGGDLPRYKKEHFDGVLDTPLRAGGKEVGAFREPLLTGKGVFVVQVLAWEPVSFEQTKDEIRTYFMQRLPTSQELYYYKKGLLERSSLQRNPAFRAR